jgi:hypothetical protein
MKQAVIFETKTRDDEPMMTNDKMIRTTIVTDTAIDRCVSHLLSLIK